MFPSVVPRKVLVAAVVVLALAGAGIWLWRSASSSSPVSEEEALASFREGADAGDGSRPGVPRAGVYTYRQEGTERGGAGPLGVARDLPDEARYVVTTTGEGFQEELSISEQHIEGVRFRVTPEGSRAVWRRTAGRIGKIEKVGFSGHATGTILLGFRRPTASSLYTASGALTARIQAA